MCRYSADTKAATTDLVAAFSVVRRSTHVVFELPSAQNMEMQVLYGLTGIGTAVADDTESVGQSEHPHNFRNTGKNMGDNFAILFGNVSDRSNVYTWNNENVHGRLRMNIPEAKDTVVFIYDVRWNFSGSNVAK